MIDDLPAVRIITDDDGTPRQLLIDTVEIKGVQWARVDLHAGTIGEVSFGIISDRVIVERES